MDITIIKLLGGLSFLACCLIFGILPLKIPTFRTNKKLLSLSNCFAGGLFIAIGLIHILPEAHEQLEGNEQVQKILGHGEDPFPWSYCICLLSFSFILLIDKVIFNQTESIDQQDTLDFSRSLLDKSKPGSFHENVQDLIDSRKKLALRLSRLNQNKIEDHDDDEDVYQQLDSNEINQLNDIKQVKNDDNKINIDDNDIKIKINSQNFENQKILNTKQHEHNHEHEHDHHGHTHGNLKKDDQGLTAYLLLLAMGIHSFFEGVAFGVTNTNGELINMFIAIISHKWSDALVVGISFVSADIKITPAIRYMIFYSFLTPIGVLVGQFITSMNNPKLTGITQAISAGTFIYISCAEIIIEEFAIAKDKYLKFLCYIIGIIFIALVTMLE